MMNSDIYLGNTNPITQLKCVECGFYYDKDDMINCSENSEDRCSTCQINHEWDCEDCSDEYVFGEML